MRFELTLTNNQKLTTGELSAQESEDIKAAIARHNEAQQLISMSNANDEQVFVVPAHVVLIREI